MGRLGSVWTLVLALLALAAAILGCTSAEASKPEPPESKQLAQEAASEWTPEMRAEFKKAHDRSRDGKDK